ncbi:hypothetical protein D3C76_650710 [compost metagenome]
MEESKKLKVDSCRISLLNANIEYKEGANGHFQIFKHGEKVMDIWATTEKFKLVGCPTQVGMHLAGQAIKRAYNLK